MLSKDEEYRVLSVVEFVKPVFNHNPLSNVPLTAELILWLAEKLKEVNEELKNLTKKTVSNKEIRCTCDGISHHYLCPDWVLPF